MDMEFQMEPGLRQTGIFVRDASRVKEGDRRSMNQFEKYVQDSDKDTNQERSTNGGQIVYTESDLKTYFNLRVLASIPDTDRFEIQGD